MGVKKRLQEAPRRNECLKKSYPGNKYNIFQTKIIGSGRLKKRRGGSTGKITWLYSWWIKGWVV